jgi:large subunit ribosomal protein L22
VVDLVRGRHVDEAQDILRFTPKRASGLVQKVLKSAIANANEAEADVRRLHVAEIRVDEGPCFRRWRPKDRGRAHPILKKMSHITVVVEER